uniref:BCD1 alpha/beta domain-containing protein n=1 Tax=Eptatretus burgeri TaxID=7764 RepID=A0A8C4QYG2_EPTBU
MDLPASCGLRRDERLGPASRGGQKTKAPARAMEEPGASEMMEEPGASERMEEPGTNEMRLSFGSAICVKNHKQETGCTGMRDKTRFVSLHSFTESHLLSDYRFLEDVSRVTDGLFRDRRMRAPSNQVLLRNKARKHAIDLRLMPYGFTKHKQNFLFFHQKIPEDQTLRSILTEYIDPKIADPIVKYYNLEMDKTIVQNLARKTIFEYPTVHVVLPSSAHTYHLLELPASQSTVKRKPCLPIHVLISVQNRT